MNKLRILLLFITSVACYTNLFAQYNISGVLRSSMDSSYVNECMVMLNDGAFTTYTNETGQFEFSDLPSGEYMLITISDNFYPVQQKILVKSGNVYLSLFLFPSYAELDEVVLKHEKAKVAHMDAVKDMGIYEGKKSEVIEIKDLNTNVSTNNARQAYARVPGLNIWENDGAGLQLSIGGRGLDPNRTSNFNVRQNGYDISADALGYPESYYTPPLEGVKEIQVVRGAASLQYGTQFGGLLNFVMKKPPQDKKFELIARQSVGSFGFYNTFTSIGGTAGNFSYYSFFQYKRGDGWRPNSSFDNYNYFANLNYRLSEKSKVEFDVTLMSYLAQQPGGLTDAMFEEDPRQSNRERNWFKVNWNLFALHVDHEFSEKSEMNIRMFGLLAGRSTVGFRPNRVATIDDNGERDLINGEFKNYGVEARFLHRYKLLNTGSVLLVGTRYYHGYNEARQGPGSSGSDADFKFVNQDEIIYDYSFPNKNVSVFAENIINLNEKLSFIPGLRYENINTTADGYYGSYSVDLAGNKSPVKKVYETRSNRRQFILAGLGISYYPKDKVNLYSNFSQNYRSITFSDMRISNPSSQIDPDLQDEKGYTLDIGLRSEGACHIMYDISYFFVSYDNRIGEVSSYDDKDRPIRLRTNIGRAVMTGLEAYLESDIVKWLKPDQNDWSGSLYCNIAYIRSRYTDSEIPGVEGNIVEFVPEWNIKTGIKAGFRNFKVSIQYSFVSDQFSEGTNAIDGGYTGIFGLIPSYNVLDLSLSYEYKRFRLEGTVNNLTNQWYFTRRATGYPGPGILPSDGRGYYLTLQVKI